MKFLKYSVLVIIILAVVIYNSSDYFIEKQLKTELTKLINKDSINHYTFSISKLDLSIVTGSVTIKDIKITPTQEALDSLQSNNNNIRVLIEFSCDKIKMEGFEVNHFLRTSELVIEQFKIIKPTVIYRFNKNKKQNSKTLALNNIFSPSFKKARLNQFIIDRASVNIRNIELEKDLVVVNNFNFKLSNAVVDSSTIHKFSPFTYDNIEFSADGIDLNLHKDFALSTGQLQFNAEKKSTSITEFKLKPNYSKQAFSNKYPIQKQWIAITLDTLKVVNINFEKLVSHGISDIDKITITKANIGLYKDKSKPAPPFKKKFLPATSLHKLPLNLTIDTIEIKNSRIVINEKGKLSDKLGELSIDRLNTTVMGFSSDSATLASNPFLTAQINAYLMNEAPVNLYAKFDLQSKTDEHFIKAHVGVMNPAIFNKVLSPLMLAEVKEGKVLGLDYQYRADDTSALGTIDFEYEGIKIEILDKDDETKKQGLFSVAANTVLRTSNRKGTKSYVQGVIKADRVQDKNLYPYLWHTVQSGIIYTMAPAFSEVKKEEKKANKKGWFKKK